MADLGTVLRTATERLRAAGVEGPRRDARLLAGVVLGLGTAEMVAHPERRLTAAEVAAVEAAVARRASREPVSRILGEREFRGLRFALTADTLDPRPDSEVVVETALRLLEGVAAPRVLDLGAGTGCLLLAVLAERADAAGVGLDAAPGAVAAAAANAAALGLSARARFVCGDWREAGWAAALGGRFDLVVANPPYIPDAEIAGLAPEVREFEPRLALAGGADGLAPYRILVPALAELLAPCGGVVFEVGLGQAEAVAAMLETAGMAGVGAFADLGGVARAVAARRARREKTIR
ncbi:peptide chain release factor N(5)-glutamine methyltransferase [Oleispirillum naphthae]|uniref:peptide chain release factor N(5)-glutamine methyltransferase n=1 Tax=Oleispirillum naphthae TaxID=2838853 RepID=UPI00308238DC